MKIEKLIKIYETILPFYKECKTKPDMLDFTTGYGMCSAVLEIIDYKTYREFSVLFEPSGYYHNLNEYTNYLFKPAFRYKGLTGIKKRIKFMEAEIIDLKKLLKKGYTHV